MASTPDVGHGPREHEVGDASRAEGVIERRAVEAVVVVLRHHELVGARGELGNHVDIGLAEEARRGRTPEPAGGAGRRAPMLRVQVADEQRYAFGIGELGEYHGKAVVAEEREERLDLRHDIASGGHFHGLTRIEEGALHVDDE